MAPMIFVMAVFLVSLVTHGYLWGITASLISVLAVKDVYKRQRKDISDCIGIPILCSRLNIIASFRLT